MKQLISEVSRSALSLVFPISCQCCGKVLSDNNKIYLCRECLGSLKLNLSPFRTPVYKGLFFKEAWHCYKHKGLIKELVHRFKYNRRLFLKKPLACLLVTFINNHSAYKDIELITAVPMHSADRIKRGFNQSVVLAKELAQAVNAGYSVKCISKRTKTKEQVGLKKSDRIKNIKNAFACKDVESFKDKNVLLIDDVFTTGSTANECSKVLIENGAKSVSVLTLTKGA